MQNTCLWAYADSKKAQISLRIYTVWLGPFLSTNRIIGYYRMYEWRAKALILCACEGWADMSRYEYLNFGEYPGLKYEESPLYKVKIFTFNQ